MTGVLDIFLYFISWYSKFQAAVANKNGVVKMIKYKNKRFLKKLYCSETLILGQNQFK